MKNGSFSFLLVDDDPISNLVAEKTLAQLGVAQDVRSTVNGEQALQLLQERFDRGLPFPDIILLDLNMPIMSGFEFMREFRKLSFSNLEKVKIIIVTSSEDRKDMQRAEALGVKDYLVKPLLEEEVIRALRLT